MKFREGTLDEYIWKTVPREYETLPIEGKTVIDLGAHIGCFSRRAIDVGASQVFAVEPDPENFALLQLNVPEARSMQAAVVGASAPDHVTLYTSTTVNTGNHTIVTPHKSRHQVRGQIEVPAVRFADVLAWADGAETSLKIDIEGGEYGFLDDLLDLPPNVTAVAIEIHLARKLWMEDLAPRLIDVFRAGWTELRAPSVGGRHRHGYSATVGVWVR